MGAIFKQFIGIIIMLVIFFVVFLPAINSQIAIVEEEGETEFTDMTKALVKALPVFIAVGVVALVVSMILNAGNELVSDEEVSYYVEPEYVEKGIKVKDAKIILRTRFAKGEIDKYEYTERMSRL